MVRTNVKQLRSRHRISQADLGKFIGVTDGTISKLENGRNYPSMELAIKLADFFDVSLDELIGRSKL
ncbi:helix-turn-helix transcriptional regulator [Liquorilactobacillus nagelii]|jgi:DNA-binding XRE family transcriptional regulator|uniref:helix-turn-helix transcriptional regulator n=1 Tax=Liquorilactobacillus nagelii TaxID=82688 RepID=UPI00242AA52A|nr:helix-turn-helix transcriptional regulator [Liquorilactobacillus nagelii]MCI1699445.1 helix-turn-helix transcriptional regulator [Liquorilactobacillus nagelii]